MSNATPEPKTEDDAQRIKRFLEAGAHDEIREVESVKAQSGSQLTLERPGTVSFPATVQHIVDAMSSSADRRAAIQLEFAGLTGSNGLSAAVFINKVDASLRTSVEDPAFAGLIGFFVPAHDMTGTMTGMTDTVIYELDITTAFKRIPKVSNPVTVTVVLLVSSKASPPSGGLAIQGATLRVVDSVVKRG
jgi:hypothetical protein